MEDLDLDELDQAVTKMMDKTPKGKRAVKKEPLAVPARPEPATAQPPSHASGGLSTPDPQKASEESPAAPTPRSSDSVRVAVSRPMPKVPERRRMHPGAMDIIQPTPVKTAAPSGRPGRMAAALHPTQEVAPEPVHPVTAHEPPEPRPAPEQPRQLDTPQDVSDEVLASLSLIDEPKPATNLLAGEPKKPTGDMFAPEAPAAPATKQVGDGWPDPLDFHDFGDPAQSDTPKSDTPQSADTTPDPLALLDDQPATPADAPKETPPSMEIEPVSVTDRHEDAAFTSSSPFVTTKVEKRPLGAFADAAHEPAKVTLPEFDGSPVPHESTTKGEMAAGSLESKHHLEPEVDDSTDLRAMGIPQQYRTEDHKQKDDVRSVFDTKEYHAAPPHMYAPRKSGPGLVIGVVVLIVLIIAAVLVGYFMMTGTFDVTSLW